MKFGLSQLADIASGEDHYPVRRRGEKRRLNPNTAGIAWLDGLAAVRSVPAEGSRVTIDDKSEHLGMITAGEPWLHVWWATGFTGGNTPRPMLQTFQVDRIGRGMRFNEDCCPDCYNFAYSHDPGHPRVKRPNPTVASLSMDSLIAAYRPAPEDLRLREAFLRWAARS